MNAILLFVMLQAAAVAGHQTVNPVIGDESYWVTYKTLPSSYVSESTRISTHLNYVYERLSAETAAQPNPALRKKRFQLLGYLKEYIEAGRFPVNTAYPEERRPCFIDENGAICAVGYLIERSEGRELAEHINQRFQYEKLLNMKDDRLEAWILRSGFTAQELAMIQPTYGPPAGYTYIDPQQAVFTSIFTASSFSLTALQFVQMKSGSTRQTLPVLGLVSGTAQLTYGLLTMAYDPYSFYYNYENRKKLSIVNIGCGTATVIFSTWQLHQRHQKRREQKTSWMVYPSSVPGQSTGLGFSLSHRF